jgi:hypothetical protein
MFRQIWDGFAFIYDGLSEDARDDSTFLFWVRFSYARSQAIGVRRIADKRSDVVSLARLIDRVRRHPTVLSRERYVAARSDDDRVYAERAFDDVAAGDGTFIDPRIPAQDFKDLQAKTEAVRDWVNKSVAHLTAKEQPGEAPPLQAVHDAVDDVADLYLKYAGLIMGVSDFPIGVMMCRGLTSSRFNGSPTPIATVRSWTRLTNPNAADANARRRVGHAPG